MSEPGDKLARGYRDLAREEPPGALDAKILAAARREVEAPRRSRSPRWMVPVSLAAVVMLGVGLTLRMQMEQPGIETSMSRDSLPASAPQAERPKPQAATEPMPAAPVESKPATADRARAPARPPKPAPAPAPERPAQRPDPNPFADAPVALQQAPAAPAAPPAALAVPAPARTEEREMRAASPGPASAPPIAAAGSAADAAAPAPRAKREAAEANGLGAQALRKSVTVPDPDPERELERIARLREAGRHAEADRALEQFRRDHPAFRIPEATWERVRAR